MKAPTPQHEWECYGPQGGLLPADGTVQLAGLVSRPELNGTEATVLKWDAPSGRFAVRLSGGDECIKLKRACLRTPQDTEERAWANEDHEWLLPMDLVLVVARCLSARNVAVLSAGSRSARAALCLRPAATPLWEQLLLRGFGPAAPEMVQQARPGVTGPCLCRCARGLRQLFDRCLEVVPGGVDAQAGGAEVVACPVLSNLMNAGIGAQGAVRHAAGRELEEAVRKLPKPLPQESTVLVTGGPLARYVALAVTEPPLHILSTVTRTVSSQEERIRGIIGWLERLHENLLRAVREKGCRTLAMPTLCTGGMGMPPHLVISAVVRVVRREFCAHPTDPIRIRIACFERDQIPVIKALKDAVSQDFYRPEAIEENVGSLKMFRPPGSPNDDDEHEF